MSFLLNNTYKESKVLLKNLNTFESLLNLSIESFKLKYHDEVDNLGKDLLNVLKERKNIVKEIICLCIFKPVFYQMKIEALILRSSGYESSFSLLISTRGLQISTLELKKTLNR